VKKNIETLYRYKGQTKELQGISFEIGEYKYKGSEIDRKFSVKNLEKAIYHQQVLHIQNYFPKKTDGKNIANLLLKPKQDDQLFPYQWRIKKQPKKKKPNGWHL
jgi:hypothetical protein